jgi:hypothetical protein
MGGFWEMSMFDEVRRMNARQLIYQALNFAMIVSSALMIWKGLMVVTGSESPIVVVLSGSMEPAFFRGDLLFLTNYQVKFQHHTFLHVALYYGSGFLNPGFFSRTAETRALSCTSFEVTVQAGACRPQAGAWYSGGGGGIYPPQRVATIAPRPCGEGMKKLAI